MYQLVQAKSDSNYNQSPQGLKILFSFGKLSEDKTTVSQLFYPVICREYFGDILYAEETGVDVDVYGFSYRPKKQKIDRDATRLTLKADEAFLEENLKIIHEIEDKNKVPRTKVIPTNEKDTVVIEGDEFWQSRGFLISLYTYLLKLLYVKFESTLDWIDLLNSEKVLRGRNESFYLKNIGAVNLKIVLPKLREISEIPITANVRSTVIGNTTALSYFGIHSYHGMVSIFGDSNIPNIYHQYIKELYRRSK